jgi:hypothetical protein
MVIDIIEIVEVLLYCAIINYFNHNLNPQHKGVPAALLGLG